MAKNLRLMAIGQMTKNLDLMTRNLGLTARNIGLMRKNIKLMERELHSGGQGGEEAQIHDAQEGELEEEQALPSSLDLPLQQFSLSQIIALSILCALLLGSVLLNLSLLTGVEENATHTTKGGLPWVLILGLLVVTAISLVVSFWTYYIRSIYIKDGPALVPEKWGSIIGKLIKTEKQQHAQVQATLAQVQESSATQTQKSNDLLESFLTLQGALNAKDDEIARLKKGYDAKIFKHFLRRFIRIDQNLRGMLQEVENSPNPVEQKNYEHLSRIMGDALEECGVTQFIPELGSDYRDANQKIADDPSVQSSDDESQDFKIAAVESVGYILEGEEATEVIVPAKVSIFRVNPKSERQEECQTTSA